MQYAMDETSRRRENNYFNKKNNIKLKTIQNKILIFCRLTMILKKKKINETC